MRKVNVLYIDNDSDSRAIAKTLFTENGVRCDVAQNGKIGFDLFLYGVYNYVVIDYNMPLLNGFETAKIIQQAGHWLHAEKTVIFNKIVRDFLVK